MEKPPQPRPEPPAARDDVRVVAHRCPYCREDVPAAEGVVCRDCLTRHHPGCWDEGRRCSSCGSEHALRPARPPLSDARVRELLGGHGYGEDEVNAWLAAPRAGTERCRWAACAAPATAQLGGVAYCEPHARLGRTIQSRLFGLAIALFLAVGAAVTALAASESALFLIPAALSFAAAVGFALALRHARRTAPQPPAPPDRPVPDPGEPWDTTARST